MIYTKRRLFVLAALLPGAILANINSSATLNAGQNFSFDSGTVVSSGGDIQFTATQISFVGSAKGGNLGAFGFTGSTTFGSITQAELQALQAEASNAPIATSALTAGTSNGSIIALGTNGGNVAAFLVTALSSNSISFQFVTFESGTGGPPGPTITGILNGSSKVPAGFPNSGISPSTLFAIEGSNMADPNAPVVNQNSASGLPTTLNGATVTIAIGGKNYTPALYHALSYEIAGVVPAATPTGTATITVNYNGQSASAQVQIVPSAYGIDNYDGNTAVVTDAQSYLLIAYTTSGGTTLASATPGEYLTVWGTGLGSDPLDSDTTSTSTQHAIPTPVQVYIGGVQATNVLYSGEGTYPGVHIVIFQVPKNVPTGCFVPIAILTGSGSSAVVSNTPTVPVTSNGGVCTDAYTGLTGTQISSLQSQTTVSSGTVFVGQSTAPAANGLPTTNDVAFAEFEQVTGSSYSGGGTVSLGTCSVTEVVTSTSSTTTTTGLNAGTITVTPPGGSAVTLTAIPQLAGYYEAQLSSGAIPASGGTFAFTGSGATGANSVGPFSTTVNFPNPILTWTNQSASATVTRTSGQTYTWSGGGAGTFVIMSGSASSASAGVSGSYTCIAPQSALTFTVPSFVLLALPAGTGTSSIENSTAFNTFTATGLNYGYALGFVSYSVNTTWN